MTRQSINNSTISGKVSQRQTIFNVVFVMSSVAASSHVAKPLIGTWPAFVVGILVGVLLLWILNRVFSSPSGCVFAIVVPGASIGGAAGTHCELSSQDTIQMNQSVRIPVKADDARGVPQSINRRSAARDEASQYDGTTALREQNISAEVKVDQCDAAEYWIAHAASQESSGKIGKRRTVEQTVIMSVRDGARGSLMFQVCKGDVESEEEDKKYFMNDIHVSIYDAATDNTVEFNGVLQAAGRTCSRWTEIENSDVYAEGQMFGGIWRVVSPARSASDWQSGGACSYRKEPTGTCFSGIDITMKRTCKK